MQSVHCATERPNDVVREVIVFARVWQFNLRFMNIRLDATNKTVARELNDVVGPARWVEGTRGRWGVGEGG